jgi:hypothetical protein
MGSTTTDELTSVIDIASQPFYKYQCLLIDKEMAKEVPVLSTIFECLHFSMHIDMMQS